MSKDETSRLEKLLDIWQSEDEKRAEIEAENRKMAVAMLKRVIHMGADDLPRAWQALKSLESLLYELDTVDGLNPEK